MPDSASCARPALAALAAVLVLATGCAQSSAPGGNVRPTTASARPARPPTVGSASGDHATAADLGGRIPGCRPHALTPQAAAARLHLTGPRDAASAAACTLRGRTVIILTFATPTDQTALEAQLRKRVAFYATGPGWSAAPTDTSEAVGQQSVVQDVVVALDGRIRTGGS